MSAFNSYLQWAKRLPHHGKLKCIVEDLLPCYCYATKANNRKFLSRVSQPASAGKDK